MMPSYRHRQTILVSHDRHYRVGDVVVAFMEGREVLKRIIDMKDGRVYLQGDNTEGSTDSRHHGWIVDRHIVGKVAWPRKDKRPKL